MAVLPDWSKVEILGQSGSFKSATLPSVVPCDAQQSGTNSSFEGVCEYDGGSFYNCTFYQCSAVVSSTDWNYIFVFGAILFVLILDLLWDIFVKR